jgi:hypothetical protein
MLFLRRDGFVLFTLLLAAPTCSIAADLPAHPRLLLSDAEVPGIKARIQQLPGAAARYRTLLRSADAWIGRPVALPPRGGQWFHWYACKKDGGNLTTVSPTEHRCTICGTVYSGWPYDDVILSNQHSALARAVHDLGLAHRLSGDAKYVPKAREILLTYAGRYESYPLHNTQGEAKVGGGHVGPQTLDEAVWLITVCQGADLVWDRLSPADRMTIETGLLRPAAETIRRHKMGIHNIQCWKNSAVGLVGLLLGDASLVADAVDSDHGFRQQVAKGINADGQWFEGAWGYHFYTLSAMASLLEAGERCGLGLYDYTSDGKSVRKLFEGPLDLAMPDLTLPPFNDSPRVSIASEAPLYELALAHYRDPRFAAVVAADRRASNEALIRGLVPLPNAKPRAGASCDFPAAGYTVLQPNPGKDATWLCLKYGPHGGGHGHPDKLNFVLYNRGKLLGYDPGTGKYGVPLHAGWQRTTIAHNTLTVDATDQKPATGRRVAFLNRKDVSAVQAEAGPIYDGVRYSRAVAVFANDVVLVLDLAESSKPHVFDFAYHDAGVWSETPRGPRFTLPDKPGYRYLADMVQVNGPLPVITETPVRLGLAVNAAGKSTVLAGTGAGHVSTERIPCVIARTEGKSAHVGWAIDLDGSVPTVTVSTKASLVVVEAKVRGKTYRLGIGGEGSPSLVAEEQ